MLISASSLPRVLGLDRSIDHQPLVYGHVLWPSSQREVAHELRHWLPKPADLTRIAVVQLVRAAQTGSVCGDRFQGFP